MWQSLVNICELVSRRLVQRYLVNIYQLISLWPALLNIYELILLWRSLVTRQKNILNCASFYLIYMNLS